MYNVFLTHKKIFTFHKKSEQEESLCILIFNLLNLS